MISSCQTRKVKLNGFGFVWAKCCCTITETWKSALLACCEWNSLKGEHPHKQSQYHGSWWSGRPGSQSINRHSISSISRIFQSQKIYKSHQSKQRIINILSLKASFMWPTWGHLGPTGPSWAPCWPHEPCYLGRHGYYSMVKRTLRRIYSAIKVCAVSKRTLHWIMVVDPLTISVNNRLRSVYYW